MSLASPEKAVVGRASPLIDDLVRATGFNSPECKHDGQKRVRVHVSLSGHCLLNQIGIFWSLPDRHTGSNPPAVYALDRDLSGCCEGREVVVSVCPVGVDYVDGQHVFRIYQWRRSEKDEFAEFALQAIGAHLKSIVCI